ncbi:MAG: DUF2974 domain-containing protein [Atopobiaceae bacterium]|nr:DUF2974 domain-containing protein [Atopobiaceae bacterium]
MADIIDYVREQQDSFAERPLNRVDSLVLSWLANFWIPDALTEIRSEKGMSLSELLEKSRLTEMCAPLHNWEASEKLAQAAAASGRFSSVIACLHEENWSQKNEEQFSATSYRIPDGSTYVAFRGTDNTLLGWKENFNMAFQSPIPAQASAHAYLSRVAQSCEGPLYVGGHSKGGNLAVYATMRADESVRKRVTRCFSHDGPGMTAATTHDAAWTDAWELVDKTIPDQSLVGLLFEEHWQDCTVVRSSKPGLMQHSPFTWLVEGCDFSCDKAISYDSYKTNKRLQSWLSEMNAAERERLVEVLYKLVRASGEVTFSGLVQSLSDGSLNLMLQRLDNLPEADRAFFIDAAENLAATMLLGPAPTQAETPTERASDAASRIDDATARFNDRLSELERRAGL